MRKFEDPEFLSLHRSGIGPTEIAKRVGLSPATVQGWVTLAVRAGLLESKKWTPERDAQLTEFYVKGATIEEIIALTGWSKGAIQGRVNALRLSRRSQKHWSESDIEKLRDLTKAGKTAAQVAKVFGRTITQIESARIRYGIKAARKTVWTQEAVATLTRLWNAGNGGAHIARLLGMNRSQVEGKIDRLGFERDRGYPVQRAKGTYDYAHLRDPAVRAKAAQTKRANMGLKPAPSKKAKVVSAEIIPMTARPWLTRKPMECTYPYGLRGNIHSCCQPVFGGTTYCEEHAGLCYDYSARRKIA